MWWKWLSETRSRGGGGSAARFFFPEKWGKTLFFRFGARKPTPPPQGPIFQVSAQASANQRPRTTACGLHPGPLKCLVAWALTLKIVPWAGGVGSAADVWRCKWWSVIDEKVVVNRFYCSFQMYVYMYVCIYICIVEIKCLKILFLYIGQWIFAVAIFIKFLKLFRYSGEKVAQMGYKKRRNACKPNLT